jgi:gas vesicle protein
MGKVKNTLFLGSLIGAGLVWLTGTKKGKEMRDQILDASADIYLDAKKKLGKMDKKYHVSKTAFTKLAKETLDTYFQKSPLAGTVKDVVLKMVLAHWDNIKDEVEEKVVETKKAAKSVFKKKIAPKAKQKVVSKKK